MANVVHALTSEVDLAAGEGRRVRNAVETPAAAAMMCVAAPTTMWRRVHGLEAELFLI